MDKWKFYNKSINSLLRVSLCTWKANPTVNGVSITRRKVLLLILVICLSVLTELIMTYPTMSISFSISSFLTQVFWCSDYSVQKRLQSLWNRKSLECFPKKSFVSFQDLGSYFGSLKDGVEIVWWVIEAINCGFANVGQIVSLVNSLQKFD